MIYSYRYLFRLEFFYWGFEVGFKGMSVCGLFWGGGWGFDNIFKGCWGFRVIFLMFLFVVGIFFCILDFWLFWE